MASHQSNSQNNETIRTPTEHQTSSAIKTGRRNIANIYLIKVAIEILEEGVKHLNHVVLVFLLLTLNIFHIFF